MMGRIFRSAEQKLVWLGEEGDGSIQAIKFLRFIEKAFWAGKEPSAEWLAKVVSRTGAYGKVWEALEKLFRRQWWEKHQWSKIRTRNIFELYSSRKTMERWVLPNIEQTKFLACHPLRIELISAGWNAKRKAISTLTVSPRG